jgi:hypothetical protein
MKMTTLILTGAFLIFGAASSFAAALFDFNEGTEFDAAGMGASMTVKDGSVSITMETVDIIGQDGSLASDGAKHKTNIYKAHNAMGINDGVVTGSEYEHFNPGEGWVFSFNVDVTLDWLNTSSFDRGAELTISAPGMDDIVLEGGKKKCSLNKTMVPAGTPVTIQMTSDENAKDTKVRLTELIVSAVADSE